MKQREKYEISMLPEKYRPIGAWGYVGYSILFSIPVIGWICLIVLAFSDSNICRRSFARSYFCFLLLALILFAAAAAVVLFVPGVKDALLPYAQSLLDYLQQIMHF